MLNLGGVKPEKKKASKKSKEETHRKIKEFNEPTVGELHSKELF
jgi:hypothetical protein